MISSRWTLVIATVLLVAGCRSAPLLPADEIPADFVFGYEYQRIADPPAVAGGPAAGEAAEDGPAARPVNPPEMSDRDIARPATLRLQVKATGEVAYRVEYLDPARTRNGGVLQIDENTLQKVYDRVREADLASMKERYVGEDYEYGEETYHVVGSELREVWVDVYATRVEELTSLWNDVMKLLPERTILLPPAPETKSFLMDRTTAKIHRSNCPQLKDLVEAARVPLPFPQAGLNLGGYPCEECKPLSK